jgi:hypothetical protein
MEQFDGVVDDEQPDQLHYDEDVISFCTYQARQQMPQ